MTTTVVRVGGAVVAGAGVEEAGGEEGAELEVLAGGPEGLADPVSEAGAESVGATGVDADAVLDVAGEGDGVLGFPGVVLEHPASAAAAMDRTARPARE